MRDCRPDLNASGGHEPDCVLKMLEGADVRENVSKAPLTKQIDVNFQRRTEPGDTDNFAARSNGIHSLLQSAYTGESLLRAASGAFKYDVRSIAVREVANRGDWVVSHRVDPVVGAELLRHGTGFVAHVYCNDPSCAAYTGHLHALQSHASLTKDDDRIAYSDLCRFNGGHAITQRLKTRGLVIGDPIIYHGQRNLRQYGVLRKTARQLKTDDRPLSAKMRNRPDRQSGQASQVVWLWRRRDRQAETASHLRRLQVS